MGFDDSPLASRLWPSLTTVRLPIRDMGRLAAAKLLPTTSAGRGGQGLESLVVPHLIVRDSSRPAAPLSPRKTEKPCALAAEAPVMVNFDQQ